MLHIKQPVEFGVYEHNEFKTDIEVMQSIAYTSRRQNALLRTLLALFLFWFRETFEDIHPNLPKERTLQVARDSARGQFCCFMVR